MIFPGARCPENTLGIDKAAPLLHSARMAKPALGRGLGALLGGSPIANPHPAATVLTAVPVPAPATALSGEAQGRVLRVPLSRVHSSPLQPRKDFPAETLQELADSIRAQGIVQ